MKTKPEKTSILPETQEILVILGNPVKILVPKEEEEKRVLLNK